MVAIERCVATQQKLLAEVESRVDDLPAHFRRRLLGGRIVFAMTYGESPAAEHLGVEAEGFAAVALEMQMRTGMHDAELRCSIGGVRF